MDLKLKFISIRKARAEEEKVNTHKQVQRLGFRDSARVKQLRQIEADMVQDSKATTWGEVARCKIEAQYKGGVRADSMSSRIVAAGERRGSLGVDEVFLSHEMRGPAGTGRGGVSMAGGR